MLVVLVVLAIVVVLVIAIAVALALLATVVVTNAVRHRDALGRRDETVLAVDRPPFQTAKHLHERHRPTPPAVVLSAHDLQKQIAFVVGGGDAINLLNQFPHSFPVHGRIRLAHPARCFLPCDLIFFQRVGHGSPSFHDGRLQFRQDVRRGKPHGFNVVLFFQIPIHPVLVGPVDLRQPHQGLLLAQIVRQGRFVVVWKQPQQKPMDGNGIVQIFIGVGSIVFVGNGQKQFFRLQPCQRQRHA